MSEHGSETINGKRYSLWPQFVERKSEFIGGVLQELASGFPETGEASTTIIDIVFRANGDDSAWFEVEGERFGCGFDVQYGGVIPGENGWITFAGYGGHKRRIQKPSAEGIT